MNSINKEDDAEEIENSIEKQKKTRAQTASQENNLSTKEG